MELLNSTLDPKCTTSAHNFFNWPLFSSRYCRIAFFIKIIWMVLRHAEPLAKGQDWGLSSCPRCCLIISPPTTLLSRMVASGERTASGVSRSCRSPPMTRRGCCFSHFCPGALGPIWFFFEKPPYTRHSGELLRAQSALRKTFLSAAGASSRDDRPCLPQGDATLASTLFCSMNVSNLLSIMTAMRQAGLSGQW